MNLLRRFRSDDSNFAAVLRALKEMFLSVSRRVLSSDETLLYRQMKHQQKKDELVSRQSEMSHRELRADLHQKYGKTSWANRVIHEIMDRRKRKHPRASESRGSNLPGEPRLP